MAVIFVLISQIFTAMKFYYKKRIQPPPPQKTCLIIWINFCLWNHGFSFRIEELQFCSFVTVILFNQWNSWKKNFMFFNLATGVKSFQCFLFSFLFFSCCFFFIADTVILTIPLKNSNFYFGRREQTTFITIHWVQSTEYSNTISVLHSVLNYTKEVQYTYVNFVLVRVLKVLKIEFII